MGRGAGVHERLQNAPQSATALQYSTHDDRRCDPSRQGRKARARADAMGAYPGVVEEVGEGDAGDVQCARGIRRRQTNVPHGLPETALHHSSQRRFYEWTGEKGDKQPHLFMAADGSPVLAFAGLWDRWRYNGEDILSCTIIVRAANRWMATYHDRMPVILDEDGFTGGSTARLISTF
jgi:SOS response associated peptidase (SRAP)